MVVIVRLLSRQCAKRGRETRGGKRGEGGRKECGSSNQIKSRGDRGAAYSCVRGCREGRRREEGEARGVRKYAITREGESVSGTSLRHCARFLRLLSFLAPLTTTLPDLLSSSRLCIASPTSHAPMIYYYDVVFGRACTSRSSFTCHYRVSSCCRRRW